MTPWAWAYAIALATSWVIVRGVFNSELLFPLQLVFQRLALDVGHDVVQEAFCFTGVDQCQDVGMIELGRDLDLVEEPLGANDRSQLRSENLHRDLAVMLRVPGEVHRCHTPSADLPLDGIAVDEGGFEAVDVGHEWMNCRG